MRKVAIEELDEIMKAVVKRQIELKSNYSVEEMVSTVLKNVKNGNYKGITRSCIPFFQSINIEKTLVDIMGCDFENAVYIYSKRIDAIFKQGLTEKKETVNLNTTKYDLNYILNAQVYDVNQVKELLKGYSNEEIMQILTKAYEYNNSFAKLIEQGHNYVTSNDTSIHGDDLTSKIKNFITFVNHYDIYQNNIYRNQVNDTKRNLDSFLESNIPYNDKVKLLMDIYYDNYNPRLATLPFDITKQEVTMLLLKNLTEVGLSSSNMNGLDDNERVLYSGMDMKDIERTLSFVNDTVDKLIGVNANKAIANVDSKSIINNLNNLSYQEIKGLSGLYALLRRNANARDVLENAPRRVYALNEQNKTRYSNMSSIYDCVNSKEFMETLSKNTYQK